MKKAFLLILIIVANTELKAQFVSIPDSTFRNFLYNKYPRCFNSKHQMDTTCVEIINEKKLNIDKVFIKSTKGLKYFKNLKVLKCRVFETLCELPNSLEESADGSVPTAAFAINKIYLNLAVWN